MEQIWGLGFVERETGRLYVEIVPDRKARTLLPIIRRWIKESTSLVITDEWKSYSRLVKMGYNHRTIKHKKNFVDPNDPRIYTQTIENRWGQIKSLMKKRGRISRISFDQKVKEMTWRIMNRTNLQEKLLEVIKINIK